MKKFGFTMAELLVTLTIVGVVAAITAPMVDNLLPDKNKSKVLKVYKTLSDINYEILNDPSLYMSDGSCEGLACSAQPSDPSIPTVNDVTDKYCVILKKHLDIDKEVANNQKTFVTKDGIWWQIGRFADGSGFAVLVDFDVNVNGLNNQLSNDNKGCNAFYSVSCKKHPDRYSFAVANNGIVKGSDMLTTAYLENPTKLNDKKKDYERAAVLYGNH